MFNHLNCCVILLALLLLASCSKPDSLSYGGGGLVTIAYLKSRCSSYPITIAGDLDIEGVVVSSDIRGEFYKTLVIEDDTGGVEVRLDRELLFTYFQHGSRVRVRCNSLVIGMYGKVAQLGVRVEDDSRSVGRIPDSQISSRVKTVGVATQRPDAKTLTFTTITSRYVSCLVRFEDVGFVPGEVGGRWSDPDQDSNRSLVDRDGNTLTVRTSHNCDFAASKIPPGSGSVEGILSYFNNSYQLRIYDSRDVVFE